jgi:lipopolysaccharide export system ATP-binding protein
MLDVRHLKKRYGKREVVRDFSCEVRPGEVVGLLGPNGAGKTTCFYMIVGLIGADSGSILLDGHDLSGLPMHARALAGVGYLPQEASVFRRLSVADNVKAVLELNPRLNEDQRRDRLEQLLEELQVEHLREQLGISLSGGERRRVEIARALAADPKFMLLDEPFAGVDPISVADIQRIIAHLKDRGIGVLITDHNVRETLDICDRAYVINAGEVLAEGDAQSLVENPKVREVYLGQQFRR